MAGEGGGAGGRGDAARAWGRHGVGGEGMGGRERGEVIVGGGGGGGSSVHVAARDGRVGAGADRRLARAALVA